MTKKAPPILNLPDTLPLGERVRVHVSFGVSDDRGRDMGAEVVICHKPACATLLRPSRPAHFAVFPYPTRDGLKYSAMHHRFYDEWFATYAEAVQVSEKYMRNARRRARDAARDRASKT